jgi:hypothetical protein
MEKFICSICNKDTSNIDYDYLVGTDHLSCVLETEKANKIETCVLCGVETPYKFYEHIDMRHCYIEGCGQLCEKCYTMGTNIEQILVPVSTIMVTPNDSELGAKVRNIYWETR